MIRTVISTAYGTVLATTNLRRSDMPDDELLAAALAACAGLDEADEPVELIVDDVRANYDAERGMWVRS